MLASAAASVPATPIRSLNLAILWNLALENNPSLGIPAGQTTIESAAYAQEHLPLFDKKVDALARIRRAYYQYLGALSIVRVNEESLAGLERGLPFTRKQVEATKTQPHSDLIRINVLLEQARIRLALSRVNLNAAWEELVSDVGVAGLTPPQSPGGFPNKVPQLAADAIRQRVQEVNSVPPTEANTVALLSRETTAAIARYQAARQYADQLASAVIPQLEESMDGLRKSYQAAAGQTPFAEILSMEQALQAARLTLAETRQALWLAVADLQSLMRMDIDKEFSD
jgi:outer membrane protein TolC